MQPLPEKVTAMKALEPPTDIENPKTVPRSSWFLQKFIPFFTDITACLHIMLRKEAVFTWMEQYNNVFKLLIKLVKMPRLQYPNPNKTFMLFTDASKYSYSGIHHEEETPDQSGAEVNLIHLPHFSGSFGRTQQLWNTTQKECYAVYWSIQNLHST